MHKTAYNRWLSEKVLPESEGPLLFDAVPADLLLDPDATLRSQVETFGDRPGVGRLHGDDRAQPAGQRQRLHEGLPGH